MAALTIITRSRLMRTVSMKFDEVKLEDVDAAAIIEDVDAAAIIEDVDE